jgi:hypothetical protein
MARGRPLDCSASFLNPMMEGPGTDSKEKHAPVSDTHTVAVDSLIALDRQRPIREVDICSVTRDVRTLAKSGPWTKATSVRIARSMSAK